MAKKMRRWSPPPKPVFWSPFLAGPVGVASGLAFGYLVPITMKALNVLENAYLCLPLTFTIAIAVSSAFGISFLPRRVACYLTPLVVGVLLFVISGRAPRFALVLGGLTMAGASIGLLAGVCKESTSGAVAGAIGGVAATALAYLAFVEIRGVLRSPQVLIVCGTAAMAGVYEVVLAIVLTFVEDPKTPSQKPTDGLADEEPAKVKAEESSKG